MCVVATCTLMPLLPIGRCRRDEKLVKVDRPRRPWAPDKRVEWPVRRP